MNQAQVRLLESPFALLLLPLPLPLNVEIQKPLDVITYLTFPLPVPGREYALDDEPLGK